MFRSFYPDDLGNRLTGQSDSFATAACNVGSTFGFDPASQIDTETRDNDTYASLAPTNGTTAGAVNGLNRMLSKVVAATSGGVCP